jgi:hypothetical protein
VEAGRKNTSEKKDWCTPPKYIKAIYDVLDNIELDPCSNQYSIVKAETEFIYPNNDGLKEEWNYKTIYVNPPYGRDSHNKTSIKDWLYKCTEANINYKSEILALIPVAPNTKHWKENIFKHSDSICFLSDTRLKFLDKGNIDTKGAPMACAMIYWGENSDKFKEVFDNYGKVFKINN